MATISSTGVGSGLDVNNIVSSLMALEQRPLKLLQNQAGTLQTRLSAFGTLKGQVAALGDVATRLADPASWKPLRIDSANTAAVNATATSGASAGSWRVEVQQLAQSQNLASGAYAGASTVVGTGSLTIERGTTSGGTFTPKSGSTPVVVSIGSGAQTLAGVRDAINAAKAGVTASIVTSPAGSQLVLRGEDGAASSLRITATDGDGNHTDAAGLSALAWDPAAAVGSGRNLTQTRAAQDAQFTVNGLALTSATNQPTGVIEGMTLQLRQVTTQPVDVTATVEAMALRKNVNDFIGAYNGLTKLLLQQTQADPGGSNRGPLQADSTALGLLSTLRETLRGALAGGSLKGLSDAGIELQRDGTLAIKETRFAPLLEQPQQLAQLFSQAQAGGDLNTRGFGVRFKQWAAVLTADSGTLASRMDGLKRSADANQRRQGDLQDKLSQTEARLRAQYQRLDSDMSRLNAQMSQMRSALGLNTTPSK